MRVVVASVVLFALLASACTYNSNLVLGKAARIELATANDPAAEACATACANAPVFADCLAQCANRSFHEDGACAPTATPGLACATIELRGKAKRPGQCAEQQPGPNEHIVSCDSDKHLTGGGLAAIIGGAIVGAILIITLEVLALRSGPL